MDRKTQQLVVTVSTIAGLVLLAIAGGFYFVQHKAKKYKNDQYHFSINYPTKWTMEENVNGAAVIFYSPLENDLDYFKESLNVVVQDISAKPLSLVDYSRTAINQMKAVFGSGMEVIDSSPTTVNMKPAHRFVFKGTGNPKTDTPLQYMSVWVMDGYTAYQLTYTSFATKYDLFLPQINDMISSFRFTK